MAKFLLAFDVDDVNIGSFNQGCMEDVLQFFDKLDHDHQTLLVESKHLNPVYFSLAKGILQNDVFVAYSHGTSSSLVTDNGDYVSSKGDLDLFSGSFFYTVSCHSATLLGHKLVEEGCLCYIGYKKEFHSWLGYRWFQDCANHGLFIFLKGLGSYDAFSDMKNYYNDAIDEASIENPLAAASLRYNRDALVIIGNDISIDFWNSSK